MKDLYLTRLRNFRDAAQEYQDGLEGRIKNRKRGKINVAKARMAKKVLYVMWGLTLLPAVYVSVFYYPLQFYDVVGEWLVWIQIIGMLFFVFALYIDYVFYVNEVDFYPREFQEEVIESM